jgi:small subunit ribosomal protein S27e
MAKFIRVRCTKCSNEQNTFERCSRKVNCLVCGKLLAEPTGGKSKIHATVLEIME